MDVYKTLGLPTGNIMVPRLVPGGDRTCRVESSESSKQGLWEASERQHKDKKKPLFPNGKRRHKARDMGIHW